MFLNQNKKTSGESILPNKWNIIVAFLAAIAIGVLNIIQIIYYASKTPPNTLYLAADGHYPIDYFGYLISVAQGYRGKWQALNLLTSENTPPYWVIAWPYLIIGHFSRILGLLPQFGYWLAVFVLTTLAVGLSFWLICLILKEKKALILPAFLIYIFSGPFWQINRLNPLQIKIFEVTWYYKTPILSRLSIIPHHLLANITVVLLFISSGYFLNSLKQSIFSRKSIFWFLTVCFCFLLITSLTPIKTTYLFPTLIFALIYWFFYYRPKIPFWSFFSKISPYIVVLGSLLVLFGLYFQKNITGAFLPELKIFEKENMYFPSFGQFILGSGPLIILAIPALLKLLSSPKNFSPVLAYGLSASLLSYLLFYTPFSLLFNNHNSRLLFGESYLFFALIFLLGLEETTLSFQFKKKIIILTTCFFVAFALPCWYGYINSRFQTARYFSESYKYIPHEVVEGLNWLAKFSNSQTIILTPPSFLAPLTPVFVEGRVFCGSPNGTLNYYQKALMCGGFYDGKMSFFEVQSFLRKENIKYIVWTEPDLGKLSDQPLPFLLSYPNLKLIYSNPRIKIFETL